MHFRQLQSRPNQKMNQSFDFFKSTKVSTCSYVKKQGEDFVAIPYYYRPKQQYQDYLNKSMYTTSTAQNDYNNQRQCHSSMKNKPLSPYNPNAQRSRLAPLEYRVSYGNTSQIEIGDRTQKNNKQYLTTYHNHIGNFGLTTPCSNPRIMAERIRWNHRQKGQ